MTEAASLNISGSTRFWTPDKLERWPVHEVLWRGVLRIEESSRRSRRGL